MSLTDITVDALLNELASASPAPGGGSVAALAGACAASLCAMVCRITLGKTKNEAAWPLMRATLAEAEMRAARLRVLVTEDSDAYGAVVVARRLPKATEAEKTARRDAVAVATLHCARVPLETLETIAAVAALARTVVADGDPACVTDAATAAAMAGAGARAAENNVRINLPGIADAAARRELAERARTALAAVLAAADAVARDVDARLGKGSEG